MADTSLDKQLIEAARRGDLAAVERLVEQGAAIDQTGEPSGPLFNAAYHGKTDVLSWLLEHGAKVDYPNTIGSTALMGAAEQNKYESVEILLAAGANVTLRNNADITARGYAVKHDNAAIVGLIDNPSAPKEKRVEEVSYSWPVDNRTLQEVFNFEHKERVTLIRNGKRGAVEAVQREIFSEIADKSGLRKAFEEYKKKGGKKEEDEIFSDVLPKLKLKMKEP